MLHFKVRFHNVAFGYTVSHRWDNGNNVIALGRSDRAFIAINNGVTDKYRTWLTGLDMGMYCAVITCDNNRPPCGNSGGTLRPSIIVGPRGGADFVVPSGEEPMIAIHA